MEDQVDSFCAMLRDGECELCEDRLHALDDEQRLVNSLRMQNEVLVADNEEKESTIQAKQAVIDMLRDRLFPVRPVIIPEED